MEAAAKTRGYDINLRATHDVAQLICCHATAIQLLDSNSGVENFATSRAGDPKLRPSLGVSYKDPEAGDHAKSGFNTLNGSDYGYRVNHGDDPMVLTLGAEAKARMEVVAEKISTSLELALNTNPFGTVRDNVRSACILVYNQGIDSSPWIFDQSLFDDLKNRGWSEDQVRFAKKRREYMRILLEKIEKNLGDRGIKILTGSMRTYVSQLFGGGIRLESWIR